MNPELQLLLDLASSIKSQTDLVAGALEKRGPGFYAGSIELTVVTGALKQADDVVDRLLSVLYLYEDTGG